jgi:hypothetical protein
VARRPTPIVKEETVLRGHVSKLFSMDYDETPFGRPLCTPDKIVAIADWARDKWPSPATFGDPRARAVRAGLKLCPKRISSDCGKEMIARDMLVYPPTSEPRVRGLYVWHAFGHHVFREGNFRGNEADRWLLTGEFIAPAKLVGWWGLTVVSDLQQHGPIWMADGYTGWRRAALGLSAAELPTYR